MIKEVAKNYRERSAKGEFPFKKRLTTQEIKSLEDFAYLTLFVDADKDKIHFKDLPTYNSTLLPILASTLNFDELNTFAGFQQICSKSSVTNKSQYDNKPGLLRITDQDYNQFLNYSTSVHTKTFDIT